MSDIVLCHFSELANGEARRFEVEGRALVVVRIEDEVYCLDDMCSHEDFPLSDGDVTVKECEIECVRHGSGFSLKTGEPNSFPATQAVPTYQVIRRDDDVVVTLS